MKGMSPGLPASAMTAPFSTATAWIRWRASTTPPRLTSTTMGSTRETVTALANGRPIPYGRDMPTIEESRAGPDYDAADTLLVSDREQLRAIADDLRTKIIALVRDRARSIQELSQELELPKGTVGHHVKVLEHAGLIRVVRTRRIRAVTEKFYGRTARLFLFEIEDNEDARTLGATALRQASYELERASDHASWGFVRSRLTSADAKRFERRVKRLIEDFRAAESPEGAAHALVSGFWPAEPSDA